jgi:hypothetical protein
MEVRQEIADRFRDTLSVRMDELRALADIIYVEQGGSVAFYDAFENLEGGVDRTEIDMELGPVIGQLYGFNYIAVRLDDDLNMLPVRQTLIGRRPDLPTVFIHYMGGATEGGEGVSSANFGGQGHYEVIIKPVFTAAAAAAAAAAPSKSRRATTARKSGTVMLNEVATTFMFSEEELAGVLAKFGNLNSAANMSPRTKDIFLSSVARKREEGIPLSPATMRTIAALEKKAAMGLLRTSSSRSSGAAVSSETLAAIQAMGAKKTSSPRRSTRKSSPKPVGGAGGSAVAVRRSTRSTTQKKKRSSSNVSPSILAAITAMEAASLKGKSK